MRAVRMDLAWVATSSMTMMAGSQGPQERSASAWAEYRPSSLARSSATVQMDGLAEHKVLPYSHVDPCSCQYSREFFVLLHWNRPELLSASARKCMQSVLGQPISAFGLRFP